MNFVIKLYINNTEDLYFIYLPINFFRKQKKSEIYETFLLSFVSFSVLESSR